MTPSRRPASWWPDLLLVIGVAALTAALAAGWFLGVDVAVAHWCDAHRPERFNWLVYAGTTLGQGGPLSGACAVLALWLGWRRHTVRPVLPVAAAFLLTTAATYPVKTVAARPAPHAQIPHPERFGLGGVSYPSGHLVVVVVWYGVLALLVSPWLPDGWRRVLRVAPVVLVTVTTIYHGYHWVSDDVAGLMLGLLLDRLLRRVDWDRVPLGRRLDAAGWAGPGLPAAVRSEPVSTTVPRA